MFKSLLSLKFAPGSVLLATLLSLSLSSHTVLAGSPEKDKSSYMEYKADKLNLTPAQREDFEEVMEGAHEYMRHGMELHNELRPLVQSDKYDEKQVRTLIQKHHKEAEDAMVKSSRDMHEFYKTLSPEQRKQLDEMHEKMKERMKERHEKWQDSNDD